MKRHLPLPEDDGLHIPVVGEHSKHKHHFVARYVDAFTTAMKDKDWTGLHYVDLFAGAGMERLRSSQTLAWGSPMIAAQTRFPFTKLHLCEQDPRRCHALRERIGAIRPDSQILNGDANIEIDAIIADIPRGALTVCFADPYGLHLELDTLRTLSNKRADLIIFFPDRLDALRNWAAYYLDNPQSNLDRCLGQASDWRNRLKSVPSHHQAQCLRDMYVEAIQNELGFSEVDFERIGTVAGMPLYYLIFCSRSGKALQIWRRVTRKKPDGQATWDF